MEIKARVPGKLVRYEAKVGDTVKKGDIVAIMEAMKMKNPVPSPIDGVVKELVAPAGERISPGAVIAIVE